MIARILGLDFGEKRIGVAVSDPLYITAQGLGYIANDSLDHVLKEIKKYCSDYDVVQIVVGLPMKLDGTDSPQTEKTRTFAAHLAEQMTIPVLFQDERLSSKSAERVLIDSGMRRDKRKTKIDAIAAQMTLQVYMDIHPKK